MRPRSHLVPATLAVVAASAAGLPAQFLNRAAWLGSDEEGVRRDFAQGTEYFLDRFSYVVVAPWHERGLPTFGNRVDYRLGSTSGTQFTVEGAIDHALPLGDDFTFRYHVLQGENRDARFVRNAVALERRLGDGAAAFVQGEVFAEKSLIDVSAGAWLLRRGDDALRVMLTAVDMTADKSRDFRYERAPLATMASGAFGDAATHRVRFEVGGQLPFEQRDLDDDDRFAMRRWIGSATSHLRLAERDVLVTSFEAETTDKRLRPGAPASALAEDFDRTFLQARGEWWRDAAIPWSAGVLHTRHDEDGRRIADPSADLRTRRREWFGVLRVRLRAGERLCFEPQAFAGLVDDEFRDGVGARDERRFEGKLAWNTCWEFSPTMSLTAIVSLQLDEPAFGGGGAQFQARF
jgi:hypothetical protein